MNITIFRRSGTLPFAAVLCATLALGAMTHAHAARLTVADDVVVKFGDDAGLIVRDGLRTGRNTVFTSRADDSRAGQTGPVPAEAEPGDWRGLRVDPTVAAADLQLRGLSIRYAGGSGAAALDVAAGAHVLDFLDITDSLLGVRASEASSVRFNGLSLNRNAVGFESRDNSTPVLSGSDISANTDLGVLNLSPQSLVQAVGNWWGSIHGPAAADNPDGDGDGVSEGVNYGQFLTGVPLLDCSIRVADGNYNVALPDVTVALSCRNAVEVRLAPSNQFDGIPFAPMASTTTFALSLPVGAKQIHTQFRAATGNTVTVTLPQSIQYNPGVPSVAIQTPAAGVEVTTDTLIAATATHPLGIAQVEFFIGSQSIGTVTQPPYEVLWQIADFAVADYTLRVVATATSNQTAQVQQVVRLRPGNIDPAAPVIDDIRFNDAALLDGQALTEPGMLSFAASAPSGIVSTSLHIDGVPVPGIQAGQGRHSVWLDFAAVPNGSHAFRLGAVNGFDVPATLELTLDVDLAPPPAPTLTAPTDGSTVTRAQVAVSGIAQYGSQVQLLLNDIATGVWISATQAGAFAGSVVLPGEGTHRIAAEARNARGIGARSADVFVTLTPSDPEITLLQPTDNALLVADTDVSVAVVDATGIDRVEYLVDGTLAHTATSAPYGWLWPISALGDGPYILTARAVNGAGRSGQALAAVVVQKQQPPAPPVPTPYTGEIQSVTPATSYGPQPIRITGRAVERDGAAAAQNALLQLAIDASGYQRRINVATDASGTFDFNFQPAASDAGVHRLAALHPDEAIGTWPSSFTIDRLGLNPTSYRLQAARTIAHTIRISVSASTGNGATGVRLAATPSEQPSGALPNGVQIDAQAPVTIASGGSRTLDITFLASNAAPQSGTVVLALYANESGSTVRGRVSVPFTLSAPQPMLVPQPTALQTGLAHGEQRTETVQLENRGLITAEGVAVQLLAVSGSGPAPAWMQLSSPTQLGAIPVGASQPLQVTFNPDSNVTDGVHQALLRVASDNAVGGDIPVAVSVTQSGVGGVQFHVADIYTATLDGNGQPIPGLAGARIRVLHETVPGLGGEVTTDSQGVGTLPDLPAGHYTWRASAADHTDAGGRVHIRPGIVTSQEIFLGFDAISIEWDVTETTIEDEYEVVIGAVYQTEVPAPVVLIEPSFINLPAMQQGEEVSGQITISNYGLVRADNLIFTPTQEDANFTYTFIGEVPGSLAARERITLGYKVTARQPLSVGAQLKTAGLLTPSGAMSPLPDAAKSGNCHTYRSGMAVSYDFECANGSVQPGSSSSTFGRTWGTECGGSGGGGGWGGGTGGPGGTPLSDAPGCTPNCEKCCNKGGGPGG